MKLVFFISHLGNGGAEMHLTRLANGLVREGHNVVIVVARGGGSYEAHLDDRVCVSALTHSIKSSTAALIISFFRLPGILRREKPQFVMSVLPWPNLVALSLKALNLIGQRLVINVQNTPFPFGGLSLMQRLTNRLCSWLYPYADGVVCLSRGVAGDIRRLAPRLDVSRMREIANIGWDDTIEPPSRADAVKMDQTRFNLIAVGRLTRQKGYEYLVDAIAHLHQRMPVHLHILGKGQLQQTLNDRVAALGLSDVVTFWGFKTDPHVYMAGADLFVLPSLWEGFGNVIVEAMACGRAVVATNCNHGPSEILDEGCGILVPVADAHSLAAAIFRLYRERNTTLRQMENQAAGRSRLFSTRPITEQYIRFFRGMAPL